MKKKKQMKTVSIFSVLIHHYVSGVLDAKHKAIIRFILVDFLDGLHAIG